MEKLEAQSKSTSSLPPDHRAFLDAAHNGDIEKIRELLAKGVPVDVREDFCLYYHQNEQTALMYAAGGGHLEIVQILLKAGASVNVPDKLTSRESGGEQTALHYAAMQPNVAIVEELLKAGADPNALTKNAWNRGYTPLLFALRRGHREIVQLLVKRTNLSTKIGRKQAMSPLYATIHESNDDVPDETIRDFVLWLLECGAEPNGVGDANETCVFCLAGTDADDPKYISIEIANQLLEKLLKAGARPDWINKFDSTPLESALMHINAKAVKLLLEAGVNVNGMLRRGTALDIIETQTKQSQEGLQRLKTSPPPENPRRVEVLKQAIINFEGKVCRCKEIEETLRKFGAKRKAELSETGA